MPHHIGRAMLPINEVNLLDDHVADVILDSAAMSTNVVEREGVSISHPSKFILVGTMNPEEGELRPQLLDRFGLQASVESIDDAGKRVEIVKQGKRGKMRWQILTLLLFLATTALLAGTVTAVPGTDGVTRSAPADPVPGAEFDVKLTISGERPPVVGIVETIPEGFDFVSTSHPPGQYAVSGQKIVFAVINETEILYRVKASSSGVGSFTGTWVDMLSQKEGSIAGTGGIEEGSTTTPTPATTPTPEVPGFGTFFTTLTLVIAGLFVVLRRNKEEGGRLE
jgi:hypothetical protein